MLMILPFFLCSQKLLVKLFGAISITTISGMLIYSINLPSNQSQFVWDGKDFKGDFVGTAIYLVSANHIDYNNMVSKIAVIRK